MEIVEVDLILVSGTRYIGTLRDGLFHGSGKLIYPDGGMYDGVWSHGKHISGSYTFGDGLPYDDGDWRYCSLEDRRFWEEIRGGLAHGEMCLKTNVQPTPALPWGHYDTGDGVYDPDTNVITSYTGEYLREAGEEEREWILTYCRRGLDEDVEEKAKETVEEIVAEVVHLVDVEAVLSSIIDTIADQREPAETVVKNLVDEVVLEVETPEVLVAMKMEEVLERVVEMNIGEEGKEIDAGEVVGEDLDSVAVENGLVVDEVSEKCEESMTQEETLSL